MVTKAYACFVDFRKVLHDELLQIIRALLKGWEVKKERDPFNTQEAYAKAAS